MIIVVKISLDDLYKPNNVVTLRDDEDESICSRYVHAPLTIDKRHYPNPNTIYNVLLPAIFVSDFIY
jgi:hypothetical protein